MFDLAETGRQIGEKLFALLSVSQKKELAQFVRDYEAGNLPADVPYSTLFRGQYFISPQADQPLTEIQEGDLYFCLEKRLVTVQSQVISLTVKEFDIFSLLRTPSPPSLRRDSGNGCRNCGRTNAGRQKQEEPAYSPAFSTAPTAEQSCISAPAALTRMTARTISSAPITRATPAPAKSTISGNRCFTGSCWKPSSGH